MLVQHCTLKALRVVLSILGYDPYEIVEDGQACSGNRVKSKPIGHLMVFLVIYHQKLVVLDILLQLPKKKSAIDIT